MRDKIIDYIYRHRLIIGLVMVALGIRLAYCYVAVASHPERAFQPDSFGYDQLAVNIIEHQEFSRSPSPPFEPDNFRTPIYPGLMAAVYAMVGHQPMAVIWLQAIIGALTCGLTYAIGRLVLPEWPSLLAAVVVAVEPQILIYTSFLLSETVFIFLSVLCVWLFGQYLKTSSLKHLIATGIAIGILTLCRPIGQFYPIIPAMLLLYGLRKKAWQPLLLMVSCFLIVVTPWMIRNYQVGNSFMISNAARGNTQLYQVAYLRHYLTGEPIESIRQKLLETDPNPFEELLNYPVETFKIRILGLFRLLFDIGDGAFYFRYSQESQEVFQIYSPPLSSVTRIISDEIRTTYEAIIDVLAPRGGLTKWVFGLYFITYPLFLFAVYGLALRGAYRWVIGLHPIGLLMILTIAYHIMLPGIVSTARFRLPVFPLICIAAVCGSVRPLKTVNT